MFSSPTLDYDVKGHWGSMTWSYPEPRILTHVSVTPIPLQQAGAAESNVTAEVEVGFVFKESHFVNSNNFHISFYKK